MKIVLASSGARDDEGMYVLTIRDGLQTRHIGPYKTPRAAAEQIDQWLSNCGDRATWQIHELEPPSIPRLQQDGCQQAPTLAA